MDRQAAETFLNHLDPDAVAFTFQSFTDSNQKKQTYGKDPRGRIIDPLARVLHGSLEEHHATLVELSRAGGGIFVTVNKTTLSGRRSANNISQVRAYFVDCDGVPEDDIKAGMALLGLPPHIVTRSSPGKYHLYWCVIDAPLNGFRETQKQLILLFGSDPNVHDLPRVMRLPGFPHKKDGSNGEIVQLLETNVADNYSDVQFQTALASAIRQSQKNKIDRVISNLGPSPPDWTQGYPEGERNNECARRAGSCLARGMTEEETLEKCQQWNRKYNLPPLSDDEVAATVESIAKTHSAKTGQNGFGTQAESNNANANSAPGGSPPHLPRILVVGGGLSNEASCR